MSDQGKQPDAERMPPRGELVEQVLDRFHTVKVRSDVIDELSRPDLLDVGLWLTEPGRSVIEAWRRLHESLGGGLDDKGQPIDPAIAERTFYRYAEKFLDLFDQVEAEHRVRIRRLRVDDATDGSIRDATRLLRHRLVELSAEKVVTADNIEEIEKLLPKLAMIAEGAEQFQIKTDKLELDRHNLEHRAAKLEAEVERINQQLMHAQQRFDAELKKLTTKTDGGKAVITDEDITEARRLVFGS